MVNQVGETTPQRREVDERQPCGYRQVREHERRAGDHHVTLGATTTLRLQCATSAGATTSLIKAATAANGSGNNATQLCAIRLA